MRNSLTFLTGDAIYGLPQPHKWRRKVPDPATIITRKGVGENISGIALHVFAMPGRRIMNIKGLSRTVPSFYLPFVSNGRASSENQPETLLPR